MIDPTLVLIPLLVLPIVLLFRFVGCGLDAVGTGVFPPPKYPEYILADPAAPPKGSVKHPAVRPNRDDVIAYWRLLDPEKVHVTADIETESPANDERNFQDGIYVTRPTLHQEFTPSVPGSTGTAGDFKFGEASLIVSDPLRTCRTFRGGHVAVPYKPGLFPEQFTLEAWILPKWGDDADTNFEHTLFSAGGFYRPPFDPSPDPGYHGFSVVSDRTGHWQVRFSGVDLFANPPAATKAKTHLAVTVTREGSLSRVRLYVNGKEVLPASNLVFYSAATGAPLLIGVTGADADPMLVTRPIRPLISNLQEVVLHRKPLSAEEIENHVDINRVD